MNEVKKLAESIVLTALTGLFVFLLVLVCLGLARIMASFTLSEFKMESKAMENLVWVIMILGFAAFVIAVVLLSPNR